MKRPMMNETLFNTESDHYDRLRNEMVNDLTADELDKPQGVLMGMLEDFVWDMFLVMDDDQLQDMYDNLKEDKKDE